MKYEAIDSGNGEWWVERVIEKRRQQGDGKAILSESICRAYPTLHETEEQNAKLIAECLNMASKVGRP